MARNDDTNLYLIIVKVSDEIVICCVLNTSLHLW